MMLCYHASTLEPKIHENIYAVIKGSTFDYVNHANEKRMAKNVADWEYIAEYGKLIEFKQDMATGAMRALLRTDDGHCAVFDLVKKLIITLWRNDPNDNHRTINASKYEFGVRHLI